MLPIFAALAAPAAAQAQSSAILPVPLRPVVDTPFRSCDQVTASGLGYRVLRAPTGRRVQPRDVVVANYIMYDANNGMIYDEGVELPFPVDGLIPGASEGLMMGAQGGIYRFCIPTVLGYGTAGVGPIPPNADLVFQVEVVEVVTREEMERRVREAQAAPS